MVFVLLLIRTVVHGGGLATRVPAARPPGARAAASRRFSPEAHADGLKRCSHLPKRSRSANNSFPGYWNNRRLAAPPIEPRLSVTSRCPTWGRRRANALRRRSPTRDTPTVGLPLDF